MSARSIRRPLLLVVLLFAALGSACDPGGSPSSPEENGLHPGSYMVSIEVFRTIGTPDHILGRHRITFRVASPGTSAEDFSVTSAERIPPSGPVETGYMRVHETTEVSEQQWIVRLESLDGTYQFRFAMKNTGYGDFQVTTGCIVRLESGQSYQGSGCVVDRV